MKCFPKGIQKKNYKPQNERKINECFLWSWPDLWAFVWGTDDLETSESILKNEALGIVRSPIPLCLTKVFLLNRDSITLERTPVASMADWNTATLWWGTPLSVNHKAVSLGFILLRRDWIWCPAGWVQSRAFTFFSGCFSMLWLRLSFVHCDHRQLISWCQGFLVYCFSTESWNGYNSVSNK